MIKKIAENISLKIDFVLTNRAVHDERHFIKVFTVYQSVHSGISRPQRGTNSRPSYELDENWSSFHLKLIITTIRITFYYIYCIRTTIY